METSRGLADLVEDVLRRELPVLRAIPDGPETSRPNRPSGKGWSRREELGHLIDSALNNHQRIVRAALEPSYAGPGYEPDGWVAAHRYAGQPWPALVDLWQAHNAILVPLVRGIPDGKLSTPCVVGDDPPITLGFLVDDYVLHMRHHLDQILRRAAVTRYPRA